MNSSGNTFAEYLRVVSQLKEIIRAWWGVTLEYLENSETIRLYHVEGGKHQNRFCTGSLKNDFTRHLCLASMQKAEKHVMESGKDWDILDNTCHLGFCMLVLPAIVEGKHYGTFFASGFKMDAFEVADKTELLKKTEASGIIPANEDEPFSETVHQVPIIPKKEIKYLVDLLSYSVRELFSFRNQLSKLDEKITELHQALKKRYSFDQMIGSSHAMQTIYSLLDKVIPSSSTVLITGENGTGKELIARAIHYHGPRKNNTFVVQNCSAFNDNLLESELFGHVRGAFTGANQDKVGLFESAHGGTVFLDEVGDMSPAMQVKLLRVLQDKTYHRVGDPQQRKVDVRIISATNRDLAKMIEEKTFRQDLYYRLNVIRIQLPPLRERKEDIPHLVGHFLKKYKVDDMTKTVSRKVMQKLMDYHWPGNIRQLENEIERAVVLSGQEEKIREERLPDYIREKGPLSKRLGMQTGRTLQALTEELERISIREGLKRTQGNRSKLAKELGLSRKGLLAKINRYGLGRE